MEYLLKIKAISHNSYYRIYRNRYIISPAGQEFRKNITELLLKYKPECVDYKIKLGILFAFTDNRKRDLDNLQKAVIDACKGILFTDDSQIFELKTMKALQQPEDAIYIQITKIE